MALASILKDSVQTIEIGTRCDIAAVAEIKNRIVDAWQTCQEVRLDLGAVEDCDTAGVQLLVASTRLPSREGKIVRLGRCSPVVLATAGKLGLKLTASPDEQEA